MATFKVKGGIKLKGDLHPQGAKNEALQVCLKLTDAIVDRLETARSYNYHGDSVEKYVDCFKDKGDMPEPLNDIAVDVITNLWERGEASWDWLLQNADQVRRNLFNEIEASQYDSLTLFPNESFRPRRQEVTFEDMNEFVDPTAQHLCRRVLQTPCRTTRLHVNFLWADWLYSTVLERGSASRNNPNRCPRRSCW